MRLPPVCALALLLTMTASVASAQQTRRPAPRPLPQPTVATPAAPGPNINFRIRMYEVLPEKWPEVARQFRMKPTQHIQAAAYSKQIAAAIDGMQKLQMIHLMSEPEIATVSGYPASLSIDGGAKAEDEPIDESQAVRTAHEADDAQASEGYTLELLPKANGGGRIHLDLTYGEGAALPPADSEGRRALGKAGAKMSMDLRHGQTFTLVMAGPGGKAAGDAAPKIMLITPEVQQPAGAPAAARRSTRTR
jgi:hypothetical protein